MFPPSSGPGTLGNCDSETDACRLRSKQPTNNFSQSGDLRTHARRLQTLFAAAQRIEPLASAPRTRAVQHCDSVGSGLHVVPPEGMWFPPEIQTGSCVAFLHPSAELASPDVCASVRTRCVMRSHPRQHRRTLLRSGACARFWLRQGTAPSH